MGRLLEKLRLPEKTFVTIVFLAYAALTLWVTLHHEAWSDEADSWLLMRDGGLHDIFALTANRGTPLLWYLILWPFAAAGAPYLAQQLLNLAFAWGSVWLLLRSRAFPWPVKVLFAFSYYASFEYAALARNYALLMFLLFLMARQWREREERPLRLAVTIALMANTSMHGLVIAAVASLLLLLERLGTGVLRLRKHVAATAIMLGGGILSAVQLWPRPGGQVVPYIVQMDTVWYALTSAFFVDMRQETAILPSLFVLALILIAVSRHAVPFLFLVQSLGFLMVIFTFVWMGGLRHAGLLLIVCLAAIWIADAYGPYRIERLAMAGLAVSLAYSLLLAYNCWTAETTLPYSGSRDVAAFIRSNHLEGVEIATRAPIRHALLVYLPGKKLWYAALGESGSYSRWDQRSQRSQAVPPAAAIAAAEAHFRGRRWLLLTTEELPRERAAGFRLLYHTPTALWGRSDENYWLFEPRPLSE